MRVKILAIALGTSAIVAPSPANATFKDGNALYSDCTAKPNSSTYYQSDAYCMGYILGVTDTLTTMRIINKRNSCIPENVTAGQIRDIVLQYLQRTPEKRHLPADYLVLSAINSAFNCSES